MSLELKVNIVLADDHAIVLDGIQALLAAHPSIHVVSKVSDGTEALEVLKNETVDMVLTDYSMDGMDGLALVQNVKKLYPHIKIIMLSMHDEPSIVQEVFRAGVDGYILKKHTHQELINAIEVVSAGGQFKSPEVNKILMKRLQPESSAQLTDRELDVLKLLINELNTRQIAEKLEISERTVETHRKNLLRKTNSLNIVGLVKYAHAHHLI
ncbi:MAG: response regulator containing a CheY-like receiver domain and an DNA-binding domain [Flavipsychrobacter sp.]|jgi:DNA-binding NarL/FixJ family response regulator|nr:response regulator containing a CheY-like receiver domain and an DNA-binding domain [Flavipsychrobacter sp.]